MNYLINNLEIKNPFLLAPIAGYTSSAFRSLCCEYGASLVFTEMISAKALTMKNIRTFNLLNYKKTEKPIAVQLFGHEPDVFFDAIKIIEEYNFDIIDINAGCPAPKIFRNGEGSALLSDLPRLKKIVKSCAMATKKPISVKIRTGIEQSNINCIETCKTIEDAGASLISIHGRTRNQYYSGDNDYEIIQKAKNSVSIPVAVSGDVDSPKKAFELSKEFDFVMIARGAIGTPYIFEDANKLLRGESIPIRSIETKIKVFKKQLSLLTEEKGEVVALKEIRKFLPYYFKNEKNSKTLKQKIIMAESLKEIDSIM